jgi:hypothetical protein
VLLHFQLAVRHDLERKKEELQTAKTMSFCQQKETQISS